MSCLDASIVTVGKREKVGILTRDYAHSRLKRCDRMSSALIVVDVQNDFLPPDGSLAVGQGRDILPIIHKILDRHFFKLIVTTQVRLLLALVAVLVAHAAVGL